MRAPDVRRPGDEGIALVVAIGVIVVAMMLSLVIVALAVRQNRSSGVDRQRAVAVNAAEAGVDMAFTAFQSAGPTLPCGPDAIPDLDAQVPVDQPNVTVDVTYFQADGVTPITDCAVVQANAAHTPMRALITARAQTSQLGGGATKGDRAMQAFVTVIPKIADGFDNAIFAGLDLNVRNNHTVWGNIGNDADVYSNKSITCEGNQIYQGDVYAQEEIHFANQCEARGKVWANQGVFLSSPQVTVTSDVISSTGRVYVKNIDGVGGTVYAGQDVDPSSCTPPKCIAYRPQGAPPQQPFPQMPLSGMTAWTAAPPAGPGYAPPIEYSDCGTVVDEVIASAKRSAPGQVVRTPCAIAFTGNGNGKGNAKSVPMTNDLVIYADGGFSSSQQVTFTSGDGQPHRLYWIVPYLGPGQCNDNVGNINIGNNFGIDSRIDFMVYTPCNVSVVNHSDHFGQIYGGGEVTIDNKFDMTYQPLPMYGIDQASLPLLSYDVDIIYKREVRP